MASRKATKIFVILFVLGIFVVSAALVTLINSIRTPKDAPMSQMYRTEAELRELQTAVETYYIDKAAYPPPGQEGLAKAVAHLSRNVDYMPLGPTVDAWGQPFVYVPHTHYEDPESGAIRDGEAFGAPDTFQLYSVGYDGDAGLEDAEKRGDNVKNWGKKHEWRPHYMVYQMEYLTKKKDEEAP
jgi:hypothetical protein